MSTHTTKHLTLLAKNRKAQSALEYMMTYGWAILIIVIVAVILYSMGIFNPSSSITTTSIGFSPFTVSSTVCSPAGLSVAIIGGGLPDTATTATISKIYITSNTGTTALTKEYNLTSLAISPGKTATIIIPTVACTSANVKYSLSAKLQYSYSTPAGPVTTNTTGTIAGASYSQAIVKYVPLTITSSTATPNPFQQMVIVNMNNYNSYASSNLSNIEFTYPNGTIIPSWRENGTTNTQTVVYWLRLGSFTTATVYMDFFSTSSNILNSVNTGEAPQLSPTYGQYDDGANVFLAYFNGNTPISDFNYYTTYVQLSQSKADLDGNVINVINDTRASSGSFSQLIPEFLFNFPISNEQLYVESNTYLSATSSADNPRVALLSSNSITSSLDAIGVNVGWAGAYFQEEYISSGTYTSDQSAQGSESVGWVYSSLLYTPSSSSYYGYTAPQLYSTKNGYSGSTTNTLPATGNLYIGGIGGPNTAYTSQENSMLFNWMRARAYPPSGVMPPVSFGSLA